MLSSSRPPHGAPWRQRGRGCSGHTELRSGNRIQALPPSCKWGALPTHSPGLSSLQARFRGDRTDRWALRAAVHGRSSVAVASLSCPCPHLGLSSPTCWKMGELRETPAAQRVWNGVGNADPRPGCAPAPCLGLCIHSTSMG